MDSDRRAPWCCVGVCAWLALGLAGTLLPSHVAQACTIDGRPTAIAEGHRALPSTTPATVATMRTYTPFVFPGRYPAARAIHFTEARAQLTTVLPPSSLRHQLRWSFGDGTVARGWVVAHRYAHPGIYRIAVAAYYDWLHQYYTFDKVQIVVAE